MSNIFLYYSTLAFSLCDLLKKEKNMPIGH